MKNKRFLEVLKKAMADNLKIHVFGKTDSIYSYGHVKEVDEKNDYVLMDDTNRGQVHLKVSIIGEIIVE